MKGGPAWGGEGRLYAALVAALFAGVALWRRDLVLEAWQATAWTFARGGAARWKLLGEIALLGGILTATWLTLPLRARPLHDAVVFLLAGAIGWEAEAWGTRAGLWGYYTGEQPPLWIVPVWPLGAALIERLSTEAQARLGRAPAPLYWGLAAVAAAVCWRFAWPSLDRSAVLVLAAVCAGLALGARPSEDFWTLSGGLACVFFADLWGTTNGCWVYYLQGRPWGLWEGIAFGMSFDAAVVLVCLKLARALEQ